MTDKEFMADMTEMYKNMAAENLKLQLDYAKGFLELFPLDRRADVAIATCNMVEAIMDSSASMVASLAHITHSLAPALNPVLGRVLNSKF